MASPETPIPRPGPWHNGAMDHEQTFRLILILGFVVVFPIGLYHRLKSQASGERLDRRQEGIFILATLRPIALLRIIGLVAWVIQPGWMAWSSVSLPLWLRWTGVGFGVTAAMLLTWVFRRLGTNLTDTVVTRQEHTLVTTGPYRWVRHPFYLAGGLAIVADSLVTANAYLALTGALVFALLVIRTAREEGNLINRCGDDYRRYMDTTGRFLPRLGG